MRLTVGVVLRGSVHDVVLLEMLDRLGVAYEVVSTVAEESNYPLVMISGYSESAYSLASKHCKTESDILIVDKTFDLDKTFTLLSGVSTERKDNFELTVDAEQEKLLSSIRSHFFGRHLPLPRKWYWPDEAPVGCVLTHDVDWFRYSPFHKQVIRQSSNPTRLLRLAYGSSVRGRDYGWNIREMVKLEEKYGFRSTFLFQTSYGADDRYLFESAELLKRESFELALHGANSSHNDESALKKELKTFCKKTGVVSRGLRYHILKFDVPKTWEIESSAGLAYDATFFYNRFFGFRGGTCFPYHPFSNNGRIPILELPTTYMDWTALHRQQSAQEQTETFERLMSLVETNHGLFLANFHNTYINKETFPSIYGIFKSLLEDAKSKGYWVATADECTRWWNMRSSARIEPRLESGSVLCTETGVGVLVEREGKEAENIPSRSHPVQVTN